MNEVSDMASRLIGSEVLKIAGEISALVATGQKIANFTVGDFDPRYFPIPTELKEATGRALAADATNYPPSSGIQSLRKAVADFYTREFDVATDPADVLIAGGARPLIYSTFIALVNPGDAVIYPVPSWNNNHYVHLSGARGIAIETRAEDNFMPTAAQIAPHLREARLLCLNSPLNPTGTVFSKETLREICAQVLVENRRRLQDKERPLYLMFDQIYWKILHGGISHEHPLRLCPELKPWTIFVDGISKYFCSTGLRVGWSVIPRQLFSSFSNFLGHVGAWAPKPEQVATAEFLNNPPAIAAFQKTLDTKLARRLDPLYAGIMRLKAAGFGIDAIRPAGGIYLSMRITPSAAHSTNEGIRKALLEEVGVAVVPFQAFGLKADTGWFRMSVGAVSEGDIEFAVGQLEKFLSSEKKK